MFGTMNNIVEIVRQASPGDYIIIDDLTDCCDDVEELVSVVMEIYCKGLHVRSLSQPWFDTNNMGENPLKTLMRLSKLQRSIVRHKSTTYSNLMAI